MGNLPGFMELVEIHERRWGTAQYPGRPTLSDLMKGPIVALWFIGKRFIFSAHKERDTLDSLVADVLTGKLADNRKLAQIFVDQEPVQFRPTILYPSDKPDESEESTTTRRRPKSDGGIIRTPAGEHLKPGRSVGWLPGRDEVKPVVVRTKGPSRHLYQCPRCNAIQDAVRIEGVPRCPACGTEMEMKA